MLQGATPRWVGPESQSGDRTAASSTIATALGFPTRVPSGERPYSQRTWVAVGSRAGRRISHSTEPSHSLGLVTMTRLVPTSEADPMAPRRNPQSRWPLTRMNGQGALLRFAIVLAAVVLADACGDGTTEPSAPDPLVPTSITVSPATATVVEGDTLRLTATATNAHGQAVTRVEFTWASGNTAVAVVDTTGLVTGIGTGEVQVTATAAGVTGRAELAVVAPLPTTIAVTPDTVVLTWLGQTAQLTAEVRDQAGRVMDGIPVAWSSADTTVAVVDASGLVTAVSNGAVAVTATAGEASSVQRN